MVLAVIDMLCLLFSTWQPLRQDLPVNRQIGIHAECLLTRQIPPFQTQHRRYHDQLVPADRIQQGDMCLMKI